MRYDVNWSPAAVSRAAGYLADDVPGLAEIMDDVDLLAADPRPPLAHTIGSPLVYRLPLGRYRVLYEIDDEARTITIVHVGRIG